MKSLTKILFLCGAIIFTAFSCEKDEPMDQSDKFYYSFDKKIYLFPKENTLLVKYIDGIDKTTEENYLINNSAGVEIEWIDSLIVEIITTSEELKSQLMTNLKIKEEVYTCQPFYTNENGEDMGVTDGILLKFLQNVSKEKQDSLHEIYKTELIKETNIYQKFRVSKGDDALKIANKYYESGLVEFSHPSFITGGEFH